MRHYYAFLLLGAFFPIALSAQSLHFTRTYGGSPYDDARGIAATADGGFVYTGLNKSAEDPAGSMYLSKVNAAGAVLWTQYYRRPAEDGGNQVIATADGGFLLTGHTALSYGEDCDGFLVKTDANGREQWRSFIGGLLDDVCDAALELPDGSFLIAGRTEDPETHTFRMLLARVNPLGVVQFQKALSTRGPSVAYAVTRASDGQLLLAGYSYPLNGGSADKMLLVKCTPDGEILWSREDGSELTQRANAVVPTPDGGCYVVGGAYGADDHYDHMIVNRFDGSGELLAGSGVLSHLGKGYLYAATAAPEGHLAVAGVLRQASDDHGVPCFALLDQNLNLLNWQTVSLPWECRTRCVAPNPAGGFIIAGNEYLPAEKADIFVSTIRQQDAVLNAKNVAETPSLLFPNPFHDFTYIKAGEPGQSKTLTLTAADGRTLRSITFEENEYLLQRDDLPSGIYLLNVRTKDGRDLLAQPIRIE